MDKIILKKPSQLMSVVRKVTDKTMNVRFNTNEATSEELAMWDRFAGMTGHLLFAIDNLQDEDVPIEDTEFSTKTPSQRLRGVMFILWQQEGAIGDFNDYYRTELEKIINHYKLKLDK